MPVRNDLFQPITKAGAVGLAVHIYAGYLASRNMGLAIMLIALLSLFAKRALSNLHRLRRGALAHCARSHRPRSHLFIRSFATAYRR